LVGLEFTLIVWLVVPNMVSFSAGSDQELLVLNT